MTIIVVDGPNKAGKTTLIQSAYTALQALSIDVRIRHWGPLETDDREYSKPLEEDCQHQGVVIWDRSWCSEHVYGQLLNRQYRRLTNDPWLGEFLHRRAIIGNGRCFILAPRNGMNKERLDASDAVYSDDSAQECRLFVNYAVRFKWHGLVNDYTEESLQKNTDKLVAAATESIGKHDQQQIVGNSKDTLFVGSKHVDDPYPSDWLPFGSERLVFFARLFGDAGLCATWCEPSTVNMLMLSKYKNVMCVGKRAFETVQKAYRSKEISVVFVPIAGGAFSAPVAEQVRQRLQYDTSVTTFQYLLQEAGKNVRYL